MTPMRTSIPTVLSICPRGSGCVPGGDGGCDSASKACGENKVIYSNEPLNLGKPALLASLRMRNFEEREFSGPLRAGHSSFLVPAATRKHFALDAPVDYAHQQQTCDHTMTSFSSLRYRLVGTVFLAIVPASVGMYFADKYYSVHYGTDQPWTGFVVGLTALAAAW